MFPFLQKHKNGALTVLAVALFVTAGLLFGRIVDYGQFLHALTGSLTDANSYSLSGQTASQTTDKTVTEPELTGTLTVLAKPGQARFQILDAGTGNVAISEWASAKPMHLPIGNYRIVFKPMAGFDAPAEVSTEITLKTPATVSATYAPWPTCAASDWDCTAFYPCDAKTLTHTRICVLKNPRCSNGDAVQPALSESCEPGKTK
jgi:hypothetical protein